MAPGFIERPSGPVCKPVRIKLPFSFTKNIFPTLFPVHERPLRLVVQPLSSEVLNIIDQKGQDVIFVPVTSQYPAVIG